MKKLMLLTAAVCTLLVSACQHQSGHQDAATQTAQASAYACPMHCEGDKTYPTAGKCPVCGMSLKPVEGAVAAMSYEMRLAVTPATPAAGQATRLAFTPKVVGNEGAVVPLDEVHTKKMHVVVVSKDLGWYEHIHPDYQADGSYVVEQVFPAGGDYVVFADYTPSGAGNQVQRLTVNVGGTPKKAESFTTASLTTQTDGYQVSLKPVGGKFVTKQMNHLGVDITQGGKPVTAFEEIMGAKGHLVIISGDAQRYLHVHPDEVDGKLDLHTQFDQPGLYRAFFQFQTAGKLHTAHFTLDVQEGQPGDAPVGDDHGHSHGTEAQEGQGHDHSH